jgi:hypothetical protein
MRTALRIGVAIAFVLVVLGATFQALATAAVLALLEKAVVHMESKQTAETGA